MKKFISTIILSTVLLAVLHGVSHPCTSIIVGKKASKDGSVLFGHNEDDSGRRVINVWKVPRIKHGPGAVVHLFEGGQVPQVQETWAFIWFQVNGLKFSDYYANEWGVNVASDACPSREDSTDLTDGGIGYMLRRLVAERAKTAREGVEIAGELLDQFGYVSSGRTLVICDAEEGWLLSIVKGKHWVARRVPDDEVVALPNTYIIREVDFNDSDNFITSRDNARDYAIKRGWYDPKSGKPFDFAYAYMMVPDPESRFEKRGYDSRQWRAQQLFTGKTVTEDEAREYGLPFSVKPKNKLTVRDVMDVLRDHYEGTAYGPAMEVTVSPIPDQPGECCGQSPPRRTSINPNFTIERTICTATTQFSTVAQLRKKLPPGIGYLLWMCMGRPDVGVYVPWYFGIKNVPRGFNNTPGINDPVAALKHHFDPVPGTYDYDPDAVFWRFNDLENIVDAHYYDPEAVTRVAGVWRDFEERAFRLQKITEKTAVKLYKDDPNLAREFLTRTTLSLTEETIHSLNRLTAQLKTRFYH